MLTRRGIMQSGLAGAGLLSLGLPARATGARPRVVIVGGGAGGATVARALAGAVDVVLVEQNPSYTACYLSNMALGGLRPLSDFSFGYETFAPAGIKVRHARVEAITPESKSLRLSDGETLNYDKLVLSPGISFREGSVPGWSEADADKMPHAWKADPALAHLLAQIDAMPQGGLFTMIAPPVSYRCPPGPYERISMIAHRLKAQNPTAKILILDPKETYSKQTLFENAWARLYPGMIERIDPVMGGDLVEVNPAEMTITVDGETLSVDVCNVIPGQQAGSLAQTSGLTDDSGWAPVDAARMVSRMDPDIHILGDAAGQGAMPKSAFAANSQGVYVAALLRAELLAEAPADPRFANTCYSVIAPDEGLKVGGFYAPAEGQLAAVENFISQVDEPPEILAATAAEAEAWFTKLTQSLYH